MAKGPIDGCKNDPSFAVVTVFGLNLIKIPDFVGTFLPCRTRQYHQYHLYFLHCCLPIFLQEWRSLLDLDNDPELFISFLEQFPFTVSDMNTFLPYTTNLNNSLRRIIAVNRLRILLWKILL